MVQEASSGERQVLSRVGGPARGLTAARHLRGLVCWLIVAVLFLHAGVTRAQDSDREKSEQSGFSRRP